MMAMVIVSATKTVMIEILATRKGLCSGYGDGVGFTMNPGETDSSSLGI